jgi:hypothetical protein
MPKRPNNSNHKNLKNPKRNSEPHPKSHHPANNTTKNQAITTKASCEILAQIPIM